MVQLMVADETMERECGGERPIDGVGTRRAIIGELHIAGGGTG